MTIKSFVISLILGFIVYEVFSVIIGVHIKRKELKKLKESEDDKNVSN